MASAVACLAVLTLWVSVATVRSASGIKNHSALSAILPAVAPTPQTPAEPTLEVVIRRAGEYVAGYGEKSSLIVARETYTQHVTSDITTFAPRKLTAEFAIVKASGTIGWIGFRDVIGVDGKRITDREDRLLRLLSNPRGDASEAARISNESARFNIGPISRNFNVPTTVLFFFHPSRLSRFVFTKKGTRTISGVMTWEIGFKEVARPTLVMTRKQKDVPCEGTLWVVPSDGTIVRTRVQLRGFADAAAVRRVAVPDLPGPDVPRPAAPPPPPPASTQTPPDKTGGQAGTTSQAAPPPPPAQPPPPRPQPSRPQSSIRTELVQVESLADIEVDYLRDAGTGLWLPAKMSELYEGPMGRSGQAPVAGRATAVATYSDFRQFQTSAKIIAPK